MYRYALNYLSTWLKSTSRKPLVLRGARQVGKTWLVHEFARVNNLTLIEINFEKRPDRLDIFSSNDPKEILLQLQSAIAQDIDPHNSLLFLDEIQAAPEILSKLRWFAEDYPVLPVIAAGSLLEFVLHNHAFSMPVGRITYLHLEPLSFEEFLLACDKKTLCDYLQRLKIDITIPASLHQDLLSLFRAYTIVGGMPAVVSEWIETQSLSEMSRIQFDILATYRDDFSKYRGRIEIDRLQETMNAVPKMLGEKFVYTRVNRDVQTSSIKRSFELLCRARVCHRVSASSGNGLPLSAEIKDNYFKAIFLDVGLCCAALRINFSVIKSPHDLILINQGGIAEQVVGQLLRTIDPFYIEPDLFYWIRDEANYLAEIDYLLQYANTVIPVEVKSGATGSLKSLHVFMDLKKYTHAIRINTDFPSRTRVSVKNRENKIIEYNLLSLPMYLIGQIPRLLADEFFRLNNKI